VKNIPRVIDRGRDDGGGATVAAAPAPTMWEAWRWALWHPGGSGERYIPVVR